MKTCLKLLGCAIVGLTLTCQANLNAMFSERTIDVGDGTAIKIFSVDLKAIFDEANKISNIYKNVIDAESPEEKFQELSVVHNVIPGVVDPDKEVSKALNASFSHFLLHKQFASIIPSANYLRGLDAETVAEKIFIDQIFDDLSDQSSLFMGQSFKNLRNKAIYDPEGFKQEFIEFFEQPVENMIDKIEAAKERYPEYEDFLEDCFNRIYYITSRYYKHVLGAGQPDEKLLELASIHKEALEIRDPMDKIAQTVITYGDYHLLHSTIEYSADELRDLDAEFIVEDIFVKRIFDDISGKSRWFMGQSVKDLKNQSIYDPEGFKKQFIDFFDQPKENMHAMIELIIREYPEFSDLIYELIDRVNDILNSITSSEYSDTDESDSDE